MTQKSRKKQRNPGVHPLAQVETGADVGVGTNVWQFAVVKRGARVGKDCNIGAHCYVEAGSSIGDGVTLKNDVAVWEGVKLSSGVFVGPNAVFTNDLYPRSRRIPEARTRLRPGESVISETIVEYGATIGAGAMIRAGVRIGRFALVGLGAVVTRPVADHAVVVGNPARKVGWVCECGLPLSRSKSPRKQCGFCGKRYKEKNREFERIP